MENSIAEMIAKVSTWGRWGPDDEVGTLNFITPERRAMGAAVISSGKCFSLAIPLDSHGPWPPGDIRANPVHFMAASGADHVSGAQTDNGFVQGYADDFICMFLQAGTQWDSLAHIFHNGKMYNDRSAALVDSSGAKKNGIMAIKSLVSGRGVLLDLPRALGLEWLEPGHVVSCAEIEATITAQHTQINPGDVVLFYTGHMRHVRSGGGWRGYIGGHEPGPGIDVLPWLLERQVAGVASDTWAFEAIPSQVDGCGMPIHQVGIVYMGLLVGEMFFLDDLATDCALDGQYDFFFCAPPLPITGAVGSPINPYAIK